MLNALFSCGILMICSVLVSRSVHDRCRAFGIEDAIKQMVLMRFPSQRHWVLSPLYTLSKAVRSRPKWLFFQCSGGILMGFRKPSTQKMLQNKWFWKEIARMDDHTTRYHTWSSATISFKTYVLSTIASISHSAMWSRCTFSSGNNIIYNILSLPHLIENRKTFLMQDQKKKN